MAEIPVEKLSEQLNCTICLDTYTDPKILQCFHVYCQKCLEKLVIGGQLSLPCPICRHATPVPASGTAGLQSAFHTNRLLEIVENHKKSEGASKKLDTSQATSNTSSTVFCSHHSEREVDLFCVTCEELICFMCAIRGGEHRMHDYKNINEALETYKAEVEPTLEKIEKKMTATTKVLAELDSHCAEINNQRAEIETDIRNSSKKLQEILEVRQNELINQLDWITEKKLKHLATQRDRFETLQAQLSSCLEFTRESLKTGSPQPEVLIMKTDVLKQVEELTNAPQDDIITPDAAADLTFSISSDTTAVCQNFGQVYAQNSPDPSKSSVTGEGTRGAEVEKKAIVILNATSYAGKLCEPSTVFSSIEAELESDITGILTLGAISNYNKQQGLYRISYKPIIKGRHQLHIRSDGQHIKGSPFSVAVSLPIKKLRTPIQEWQNMNKPNGVVINLEGDVVIAEKNITVFNFRGEKLCYFSSQRFGEGALEGTSGVAVDGEGNILATYTNNHCVVKFTADGHFLTRFGDIGNGVLEVNCPSGIACNPANKKIYVADRNNHRVKILNPDLTFFAQFGRKGQEEGEFEAPRGIAADPAGRVYVADSGNSRIQVFSSDGWFLTMFGRKGSYPGYLNCPYGVAIDASGLVYVSEHVNGRVSVFTSKGVYVTSFGSKGHGAGQFGHSCGLAVDSSGVIYVCDSSKNCVLTF